MRSNLIDLVEAQGYGAKFKNPLLEASIKSAGFCVTPRTEDRQFVDAWIEISWGEK